MSAIVETLLTSAELVTSKRVYRFAELELYVSSPAHLDPFSHRHLIQTQSGCWYVHRTGTGYRSGTYKGLDLTLGDSGKHVGVLLRALVEESGHRIEGPSTIVDHLLRELGISSLVGLDQQLNVVPFWDACSPLHIRFREPDGNTTVYRVPRVGLSLKRLAACPTMPWYLGRPYRYLTDPRQTTKDRPSLALGLFREGYTAETIAQRTGLRRELVDRYIDWYSTPMKVTLESFARSLNVAERCQLLGHLSRLFVRQDDLKTELSVSNKSGIIGPP